MALTSRSEIVPFTTATRRPRIPLALQLPGRATLAAGKKGLYLAAWNGRGGRWMLGWDALEVASWTPVATAEILPGADLPADEPSG